MHKSNNTNDAQSILIYNLGFVFFNILYVYQDIFFVLSGRGCRSAVCLNLLAFDSCFVSVDGGIVTLTQPCHRTSDCQSLK